MALPSLVLLGSSFSAHAGTNLIRNGGFEEGPGSYPGVGRYWEPNDAQPHPAITALTGETRHGGNWSQWLKAHPEWDLGAVRQVTPYNSVTAGKSYRIQAWIKTANVTNPAGWYVFGIWWFQGDTYLGESKMPRPETNNYDWRLITWTAEAPQGADRVAALLTRHTDGDVWYDDINIAEQPADQPQIACSPDSFTKKARRGQAVPDDEFTVRNAGGGTLNYTISTDADWLKVTPTSGTSFGDVNTVAVHYSLDDVPAGVHQADITVTDPAAADSPRRVRVTLTVVVPGDFTLDGDVDQEDFGKFQVCYSGAGMPQIDPACADARLDDDDDVDLDDFVIWRSFLPADHGN